MSLLQTSRHLIVRFFGVLISRPLSPVDQEWVSSLLSRDEADLFWDQHSIDQRHAFMVARRVEEELGEDRVALVAALLHDVGKRHSDAGPLGRSLATVLDALRLPLPADWQRYRDHGELGAVDLEHIGSTPLAVAFARGIVPGDESLDRATWDLLMAADDA